MEKVKRDKIDWQEVCNRFYSKMKSQMLNMEDPSFFQFMFGTYHPTVDELQELRGYGRGLSVAKEMFLRSIYELIDEDESVLTDEYRALEETDFDAAYIEEADLFPPVEWDEE